LFSFVFSALEFFLQKHEFQLSQGSVDTLFRWGGKRLHHFVANMFTPWFVDYVTKHFCTFLFVSQFQLLFTYKMRTLNFTR